MSLELKQINFKDREIKVFVAKSFIDKMRGATIFKTIPQDADGILLVGYNPLAKDVWMKGMKFPLSIYFLDENLSVINSYENVQPCNKFLGIGCPNYKSQKRYAYVLELWR